ncbi:MAG: DUF971 domain-containing protein [Planctomycetota bacterium]
MTDSDPTPSAIERSIDRQTGQQGIAITWTDGHVSRWTARQLRDACPCATCREKRGQIEGSESSAEKASPMLPVLSAAEAQPLSIAAMRPAGSYAYNIAFSDGHSSGLFTFDRLRGS